MSNVPESNGSEARDDVEIVVEGLRLLRTRDGVPVTDEQLTERARNLLVGLRSEFAIVRLGPVGLGTALAHLDAATAVLVDLEGRL